MAVEPEHNSLASLLVEGQFPSADGTSDAHADSTDAALLSYLHEQYGAEVDPSLSRYTRQLSPVDPSVPIPSALAALASTAPVSSSLGTAVGAAISYDVSEAVEPDFSSRGEMGGKRRKPLHERAGWREMDEQEGGHQKKKPRRRKKDELDPTAVAVAVDLPSFPAVPIPAPEDLHQAQQSSDEVVVGAGSGHEGSGAEDRKQIGVKDRAEQNRRAQQAFRRRREEEMAKLKADQRALVDARERLSDQEAQIRDMAVVQEALNIERTALRRALAAASTRGKISVINTEGALSISADETVKKIQDTPDEVEQVLMLLERQCKELVKSRYAKQPGAVV